MEREKQGFLANSGKAFSSFSTEHRVFCLVMDILSQRNRLRTPKFSKKTQDSRYDNRGSSISGANYTRKDERSNAYNRATPNTNSGKGPSEHPSVLAPSAWPSNRRQYSTTTRQDPNSSPCRLATSVNSRPRDDQRAFSGHVLKGPWFAEEHRRSTSFQAQLRRDESHLSIKKRRELALLPFQGCRHTPPPLEFLALSGH
jgi:hypothetical protein